MAFIKPFKALRPQPKWAATVAAPPYDVMDSVEAKKMAQGNPLSFLHVSHAEIDLPAHISIYDEKVYQKAAENFQQLISDKILLQDDTENLYVYSLTMNGRTQTGLVACCSVEEYQQDIIKKHELTRPEKEEDRIRHMQHLNAQTGPIFLTYRDNESISKVIAHYTSQPPLYDFAADDNVVHRVWIIQDVPAIRTLVQLFSQSVRYLYIADGHHRAAAAVKTGLRRKLENPHHTGYENYNYFLSVLFPSSQVAIMDYNRVVKDLNGNSLETFFYRIQEHFDIAAEQRPFSPPQPHQFGMYVDGKWFKLTAHPAIVGTDPISMLDVTILQHFLLEPILGITDPRTDKRIDFVGGIRGLQELEKRVDSGERSVAFSLHPITMEQLMNIADSQQVMPPKSTWFEPKLRDGLFCHLL
jgi:uncharacterized protein (DUF1015 family)